MRRLCSGVSSRNQCPKQSQRTKLGFGISLWAIPFFVLHCINSTWSTNPNRQHNGSAESRCLNVFFSHSMNRTDKELSTAPSYCSSRKRP
ncbi:hypothetical protein NPIL_371021 [Nephila pilipes]|uniref:Uncharacterized protein n=1 Tax=Nephila pilipes TaxID=299642 RepID=A0A8X6THS5_NEPPI|nr:hypothetical protein NPIL_371021 [Nephila pilipes]